MPPLNARQSIPAFALFLILILCYTYFTPKDGDWVPNSRAALTYALAHDGTFSIDSFHQLTGDKAFFEGHYYTVGSIGPSLVALPVYSVFKTVVQLTGILDANPAVPGTYQQLALAVVTFTGAALPSALLGVLLYLFACRLTRHPNHAMLLTLTYALGTMAFPYSTSLFQHQLAALCMFGAFVLFWRIIHDGTNVNGLWLVGALWGLACITEYVVGALTTLVMIWGAVQITRRFALIRVLLAAVPFLLIMAFYNQAAFGSVLPVSYRYHVAYADQYIQGVMGITVPSLENLYYLTVSPFRGLFYLSPVLLLAIPGLVLMWRAGHRGIALLAGGLGTLFLLYNSAYFYWWGGWNIGPRFLTPVLPFLMLGVLFAFDRWLPHTFGRWGVLGLVALSIANVCAQNIAGQFWFPDGTTDAQPFGYIPNNPLVDFTIPRLLSGDIARNYGGILGLPGWASVVPLLTLLTLITVVAARLMARLPAKTEKGVWYNTGTDE